MEIVTNYTIYSAAVFRVVCLTNIAILIIKMVLLWPQHTKSVSSAIGIGVAVAQPFCFERYVITLLQVNNTLPLE